MPFVTPQSIKCMMVETIKIVKVKADISHDRKKDEVTQVKKSYADYVFPKNETSHQFFENIADYFICTPTNDERQFFHWEFLLRKCTLCISIAIPGVERDSLNRAPMIMFNTYTTQCTCSHHSILIRENFTTYLDAKGTSKNTCFLCEQLIQSKTPYFTCGRQYERV